MTATYKGRRSGFRYQIAEIICDEKETEWRDRAVELIRNRGYRTCICDNNWASVEVCGADGFKEFMEDWKECKRLAK